MHRSVSALAWGRQGATFRLSDLGVLQYGVCSGPSIGMLLKLRQHALGGLVLHIHVSLRSENREIADSNGGQGAAHLRARAVVEGRDDFIEKGGVQLFVKVQDSLHAGGG